jgi:hypothetical protein
MFYRGRGGLVQDFFCQITIPLEVCVSWFQPQGSIPIRSQMLDSHMRPADAEIQGVFKASSIVARFILSSFLVGGLELISSVVKVVYFFPY